MRGTSRGSLRTRTTSPASTATSVPAPNATLSDEALFMTGGYYLVDGGYTAVCRSAVAELFDLAIERRLANPELLGGLTPIAAHGSKH